MVGHDLHTFLSPVQPTFICGVCKKCLSDAVSCCSPAHSVCRTCLQTLIANAKGFIAVKRQLTCPHEDCKNQFNPYSVSTNTHLNLLIGALRVSCSEKRRGCSWTGELSKRPAHVHNFNSVACRNQQKGCSWMGGDSELFNHIATDCLKELVFCKRGGRDCGGPKAGEFRREDKLIHQVKCTKYKCRVAGCGTEGTLDNLRVHEPRCGEQAQLIEMFKRENELLKAQAAQAKKNRNSDQFAILTLRRDVDQLRTEVAYWKYRAQHPGWAPFSPAGAPPPAGFSPSAPPFL
ncbi:hypothetical protein T439DRAFT_328548 [Meredithblackwellia eburnea MCA 4105]